MNPSQTRKEKKGPTTQTKGEATPEEAEYDGKIEDWTSEDEEDGPPEMIDDSKEEEELDRIWEKLMEDRKETPNQPRYRKTYQPDWRTPENLPELLNTPWTYGGKRSIFACRKGKENHECIILTLEKKGFKFDALVDSGATHSVINQAWFDRHRIKTDVEPSVNILEVANGHLVKTKGEAT